MSKVRIGFGGQRATFFGGQISKLCFTWMSSENAVYIVHSTSHYFHLLTYDNRQKFQRFYDRDLLILKNNEDPFFQELLKMPGQERIIIHSSLPKSAIKIQNRTVLNSWSGQADDSSLLSQSSANKSYKRHTLWPLSLSSPNEVKPYRFQAHSQPNSQWPTGKINYKPSLPFSKFFFPPSLQLSNIFQ